VSRKRPELWPNDWILHSDSASTRKQLSVKNFQAKKSFSPDLAPNDFWLLPKIKSTLKGPRFQDTEEIQNNVMTALKAIPQQQFQKCFEQWQLWAKCIAA
jgi:hypothetical protein